VDHLVARALHCVTVLDISGAALARARARVGTEQRRVTWIEADVTDEWPVPAVDIWHDRAVFHFLVEPEDRARYVAHLTRAVKPHGMVIIATFALDGPERCSGLPVQRYSAEMLAAEMGTEFELAETVNERHQTPFGTVQSFGYNRFVRVGA
jgi:SAM-dependent methyltransferase